MPVPKHFETAVESLTRLEPHPQPAFIDVRHPIMLMHGFGMLASIRRRGHLHEEAMHLRSHGVQAFAPNVSPYDTVPVRAELWEERLEYILQETGAEQVNIVAHSMGGLDARYLISVLGRHEAVASLTTVSTPHHGSNIACILLEQPERFREMAAAFVDWLGTTTLADASSNVHQALTELTPEHLTETFNPQVPDHPDVRYWSYAGHAGRETEVTLNPFMNMLNRVLHQHEGPNDGFVSVESAQWGSFRGTLPADHAQQVGLRPSDDGPFDAHAFYGEIAEHLAQEGL